MVKLLSMTRTLSTSGIKNLQQFGKNYKNNTSFIKNMFSENTVSEFDVLLNIINKMFDYININLEKKLNNDDDDDEKKDNDNVNYEYKHVYNEHSLKKFCHYANLNHETMVEFIKTYSRFIEINDKIIKAFDDNMKKYGNTFHMVNTVKMKDYGYKYKNVHYCLMSGYPYNFIRHIDSSDNYFNVYAPSNMNVLQLPTISKKNKNLQLLINSMHVKKYIFNLDININNNTMNFVSRVDEHILNDLLFHIYTRNVIKNNVKNTMKKYKPNNELEINVAINFLKNVKFMLNELK
jgi:hypothetical protein